MLRVLLHFGHQAHDLGGFGNVGGDGDGFAGEGEGVEGGAGGGAGGGFARGDEDFCAACLDQAGGCWLGDGFWDLRARGVGDEGWREVGGKGGQREVIVPEHTYPEAACNPKPLEPPVTTATLPSSENRLPKSWILTSASADIVALFLLLLTVR